MRIWTIDTAIFTNAQSTETIAAHFGERIKAEIAMGGLARIVIHAQQAETAEDVHYFPIPDMKNRLEEREGGVHDKKITFIFHHFY